MRQDVPSSPRVKTSPSNAGGTSSIPSQGAKIHRPRGKKKTKQNRRQKRYCKRFNKDFKSGPCQKASLEKEEAHDPLSRQQRKGILCWGVELRVHEEQLAKQDPEGPTPAPHGTGAWQSQKAPGRPAQTTGASLLAGRIVPRCQICTPRGPAGVGGSE